MRNLFVIISTFLVISCGSQTAKETRQQHKDSSIVETNKTATVDTSFMDFFDKFMWDKEFQKSRIVFPYRQDNKKITTSVNWRHLSFYTESEYIPILNSDTFRVFDKEVETTTIGLSIVNFKKKAITNYNDSVFQINHTVFPLPESYADSEKDYETVKTTILLKDWKHTKLVDFANKLMVLSNIDKESKYRNIFYQGVENGIWAKYTFEKINGDWKLIRIEDYST